ncbi:MAG: hypothetical protein GYA87_07645 [Christensenellaceae bacterium]|nr:hypothetical protein [Christensenellaceae bacterium]
MALFGYKKRKDPPLKQVRIYILTTDFLLDISDPSHDKMGKEIYEYALAIFKKQPEFLKRYISSIRFKAPHKLDFGTGDNPDNFDALFEAWQNADGVSFGTPNKNTFILSGSAQRRDGEGTFKWQVYANFVE